MPDKDEIEEINARIKEIEQEKAIADKRLGRFRQAAAKIKENNKKLFEAFGVSSHEELEQVFKKQQFHPEGIAMFKQHIDEQGINASDFMKTLSVDKTKVTEAKAPTDKAANKRIKFKI